MAEEAMAEVDGIAPLEVQQRLSISEGRRAVRSHWRRAGHWGTTAQSQAARCSRSRARRRTPDGRATGAQTVRSDDETKRRTREA